jgi:hypothetical protein
MSTAIELTLSFHPLARKPSVRRLGRRWDIHLVIDGEDHVFEEGPVHRVEVASGAHTVEVFFTGAGLQLFAGALGIRYGRRALRLEVGEGRTARVHYQGGVFWHVFGGELTASST